MAKKAKKWTEAEVANQVAKLYPAPAYAFLRQVRNGTGFGRKRERTADAIAVSTWPSRGLYFTGIEIKVSKSDWRRELADPDKAAEIAKYCRYWYVATPEGVINPAEVPDVWGVIECGRTANIVREAPKAETIKDPDMLLLCSILRNISGSMVPRDEVEAMVNERLQSAVQARENMHQLEVDQLKDVIETFEKRSGVEMEKYNEGPIGDAVRFVREQGVDRCKVVVRKLARDAQNIADMCQRALDELETKPEQLQESKGL